MNQVCFVCGALRSGSTMLHLMLGAHPKIKNPGEFDFLFDQISDNGEYPAIERYHQWLSRNRIFQAKKLRIDDSLAFEELIYSFVFQLVEAHSLLTLNVHRGFDHISPLFPKAKFIHLIRDPRDVARSSIGMGWAGNVYYGVNHWIDTERSWVRLQKKIASEQYMEIKYEDLILSPQEVLREVCDFIGAPFSDSMLNYSENSTYSKPDSSLAFQWKKKLSAREIQYVESKSKDLMLALGYELSGYPLISIGRAEALWLALSNKLFKIKFAIRRYGFLLYAKEYISRLFNWTSLHHSAQLKMNEIDKDHLK